LIISLAIGFYSCAQEKAFVSSQSRGSIMFKTMGYDFGKLSFGQNAEYEFEFRNTSRNPVSITNVKTDCNCSSSEWTKGEIARRNTGYVKIKYDTREIGEFREYVYVYASDSDTPLQLSVKGEVVMPEPDTKLYEEYINYNNNNK
jgi:hypothetical protein